MDIMEKELLKVKDSDCKFYVGGRLCPKTKVFISLSRDLIPLPSLQELFVPIEGFRLDITSTELRKILATKSKE